MREIMVFLRGMDISKKLLEQVIDDNINSKNKLACDQNGRTSIWEDHKKVGQIQISMEGLLFGFYVFMALLRRKRNTYAWLFN